MFKHSYIFQAVILFLTYVSAQSASFIASGSITSCLTITDDGACFSSIGSRYSNNLNCQVKVLTTGRLVVQRFSLESNSNCRYDSVLVNGVKYCSSNGPSNIQVEANTNIVFKTDRSVTLSGFKICITPPVCSSTEGDVKNTDGSCKCGTSTCALTGGSFCVASSHSCTSCNPRFYRVAATCESGWEYFGCFPSTSLPASGTDKVYFGNSAGTKFNFMASKAAVSSSTFMAMARHRASLGHAYTFNVSPTTQVAENLRGVCQTPCNDDTTRFCGCSNQAYRGYGGPSDAGCSSFNPRASDPDNGNSVYAVYKKCSSSSSVTSPSGCLPCPAGKYQDEFASSVACKSCGKGQYNDLATGVIICKNCGIGKSNNEYSKTLENHCIDCIAGKFGTAQGQGLCEDCDYGTWSSDIGATSNSVCKNCEAGTYSNILGLVIATDCKHCEAGTYSVEEGQLVCKNCGPGQYQNQLGKGACINCIAGTSNVQYKSITVDACLGQLKKKNFHFFFHYSASNISIFHFYRSWTGITANWQ